MDLGLQAHKGKGNIHMIGKVKILSLFLASVLICGVGVDDVKAQTVTITDPTNDPTLQSGNGSSVTYTWSGVSMMRIKILNSNDRTVQYFSHTATDSSSPAARNFTVPNAITAKSTECVLRAEGLNVMGQVVCNSEVTIHIYTP